MAVEDLILFDQVFVLDLENQLREAYDSDNPLAADAEFLATEGFLLEGPSSAYDLGLEILSAMENRRGTDLGSWETLSDSELEVRRMSTSSRHPSVLVDAFADSERRGSPFTFGGEVIVAHVYSRLDIPCVPVVRRYPTIDELNRNRIMIPASLGSNRTALLEVIIRSLPVPAIDVPLSDVLDFAREINTRRQRDALLRTLRKADLASSTTDEFALELDEALATYSDQMRVADLRMQGSTARFFVAIAGVFEELLHARPKGAISQLIEFKQRSIDRLELETTAPGHEVALLYNAQRVFEQRRWSAS